MLKEIGSGSKMFSSKDLSTTGFSSLGGFNDPNNHGKIMFNPNPSEKGNSRLGWARNDEPPTYSSSKLPQKDPVQPLVNFCRKMLDNVHTENYKNFFQGLLADLTDDDFLGDTSLQPVSIAQQDGYVIIDENIIPREARFVDVIAPNGNYVSCKLATKNNMGFIILEKDPMTYAELYGELELKKISTLRVRFFRQLEGVEELGTA